MIANFTEYKSQGEAVQDGGDRQEQRERQEFLDLLTRTSTFDSLLGIGEYAGPSRDDPAPEGPTEEG